MLAYLPIVILTSASALALPSALPRDDDPCAQFGPAVLGNGGPYTLIALNMSDNSPSIGDTLVLSPAMGNPSEANRRSLAVCSPFIPCFRPMR